MKNEILDYNEPIKEPKQINIMFFGLIRYSLLGYGMYKVFKNLRVDFTIGHYSIYTMLAGFVLVMTMILYQLRQGKYELGSKPIFKKLLPRYMSILTFVLLVFLLVFDITNLHNPAYNPYISQLYIESGILVGALLVINVRDVWMIPKEII